MFVADGAWCVQFGGFPRAVCWGVPTLISGVRSVCQRITPFSTNIRVRIQSDDRVPAQKVWVVGLVWASYSYVRDQISVGTPYCGVVFSEKEGGVMVAVKCLVCDGLRGCFLTQ